MRETLVGRLKSVAGLTNEHARGSMKAFEVSVDGGSVIPDREEFRGHSADSEWLFEERR